MCRATDEKGGPRRCSGDTRRAAAAAAARVAELTTATNAIAGKAIAAMPAEPNIDDVVALHPEQEQMLRGLADKGAQITLSKELRDDRGRPLAIVRRMSAYGGTDETSTTTIDPTAVPQLVRACHESWQSFKVRYHGSSDSQVATFETVKFHEGGATPDEPFVPPEGLDVVVGAATAQRRSLVVQHRAGHSGPGLAVAAQWTPPGCDVPTTVRITWETGTLRPIAFAEGFMHANRRVPIKEAFALIDGTRCLYRDY